MLITNTAKKPAEPARTFAAPTASPAAWASVAATSAPTRAWASIAAGRASATPSAPTPAVIARYYVFALVLDMGRQKPVWEITSSGYFFSTGITVTGNVARSGPEHVVWIRITGTMTLVLTI